MKFLDSLKEYDKSCIAPAVMKKIRSSYVTHPDFDPVKMRNISSACQGLCSWVRAMEVYDRVAKAWTDRWSIPAFPAPSVIFVLCRKLLLKGQNWLRLKKTLQSVWRTWMLNELHWMQSLLSWNLSTSLSEPRKRKSRQDAHCSI